MQCTACCYEWTASSNYNHIVRFGVFGFAFFFRLCNQAVYATPCLLDWFHAVSVTTPPATLTFVVRAINSYLFSLSCPRDPIPTGFVRFCLLASRYAPPIFASMVMHMYEQYDAISIQNLYSVILLINVLWQAFCLCFGAKRLDKIICLSFRNVNYCLPFDASSCIEWLFESIVQ